MIRTLESIRFGYEKALFRQIEERLGPLPEAGNAEQNLLDVRKRSLLSDAVHITADLLPDIHRAYRSCLDILGGNLTGDLFVQQSRDYNAGVFAAGGKFDVLIHSALINDFTLDELCFVFGHELGHVVFGHTWFPVQDIWANIDRISPEIRNLLFGWARSSEVSADRIGLLCCGKLTPAVTALFKTSSGLTGIDVDRVLRSFRKQYQELEEHIRKPVSDSYSWVRSHPMIPIRFKALELASLDIIAFRQQPGGFSEKGFRTVDRAIAGILESLDISVAPPQVIRR